MPVRQRINRLTGVSTAGARRLASNNIRRGMMARAAAANGRRYDPGRKNRSGKVVYDKEAYSIYKQARAGG